MKKIGHSERAEKIPGHRCIEDKQPPLTFQVDIIDNRQDSIIALLTEICQWLIGPLSFIILPSLLFENYIF